MNLAIDRLIGELERRVGQNGRDCGKPPTSDGLDKPPANQATKYRFRSLRGKTERKSNGQPGHSGATRMREHLSLPETLLEDKPHVRDR